MILGCHLNDDKDDRRDGSPVGEGDYCCNACGGFKKKALAHRYTPLRGRRIGFSKCLYYVACLREGLENVEQLNFMTSFFSVV